MPDMWAEVDEHGTAMAETALCPECYQPRGHCEHTEGQSMFDREVDILPDDDPDRALVLRLAREGRGLRQ